MKLTDATHRAKTLACACLATWLAWWAPGGAAHASEEAWASALGEGMRLWAEGRPAEALDPLYRAHALSPSPRTLDYIVRAHDAVGHCGAATRQLAQYRAEFPGASPPALERCEATATLALVCERPDAAVTIDAHVTSACGHEVQLPPGEHLVVSERLGVRERVTLEAGQRQQLVLQLRPRKWERPAPRSGVDVPRILDDSERFTVFLSRDGIYQIWLRTEGPDLLDPVGASICRGGPGERSACEPLSRAQRERIVPMLEERQRDPSR